MTTYTRDDELAVAPEGGGAGRIEHSGAYAGRFTLAKECVAKTGTRGIEFHFEADDGRNARYLRLWLARPNGEKIEYPYSLLSALMTCLGVKAIDSKATTVEEWNAASNQREPTEAQVFESLIGKPVGVLLQREEREWEGKTYVSMKIAGFFDPVDRATPAEIQSGRRSGQALAAMEARLTESAPAPKPATATAAKPSPSDVSFDDEDIPF